MLCGFGTRRMRAVLGIDAAWTPTQPSGIALAVELTNGWRLIAAAASYQRFHAMADKRQPAEPRSSGSLPDASALLGTRERSYPGFLTQSVRFMHTARTVVIGLVHRASSLQDIKTWTC
jgi:hypothetical protein